MACNSVQQCKTVHRVSTGEHEDDMVCGAEDRKRKRKSSLDEEPPKRKLRADNEADSASPVRVIAEAVSMRGSKRRAEAASESPNKKMRSSNSNSERNSTVSEGVSVKGSKVKVSTDSDRPPKGSPEPSVSNRSSSDEEELFDVSFSVKTSQAEFKANYIELFQIGRGGFGTVYAGYRKTDAVPVAIKHIPKEKVHYKQVVQNGKVLKITEEVFFMVKAAGGVEPSKRSAAISLLDCFDLEKDFIMVMERPVPSVDLYKYRSDRGGYVEEDQAKIILRQLVDAAIELDTKGVFHRDIKLENILIETASNVPCARLIDFGCSRLVKDEPYYNYSGTFSLAPPEWFLRRQYKAAPTTVWQLGVLLYELLDHDESFSTETYLDEGIEVNSSLSIDCLDFLFVTLVENPEKRITLEQLQVHPWFT